MVESELGDQTVRRQLKIMRGGDVIEAVGVSPKSKHVRYVRTYQEPLFRPEDEGRI